MMFLEVKLDQDRCRWCNYNLDLKKQQKIKSLEEKKQQRRYCLIYLEISK